jgi:hypothetical protein
MLPILRILPVGGVLLAIFILVLALSPPDGSRAPLDTAMGPARGALVDRNRHPETRQFLIQAALKRANELNRLRELPDTPTRTADSPPSRPETAKSETPAPEEPRIAALPANRSEADPEETTAAAEMPTESSPDVAEPSSTEPPVTKQDPQDKKTASVETAESTAARRDARRRAHRVRHPRPTTASPQRQPSFFEIFFGGGQQYQYRPQANNGQQASQQTTSGAQQTQTPPRQQYYYPPRNYGAPQTGYNPQAVTQTQPNYASQQQQPIGSPPTFGEQPAPQPQVQQPTRAVQRPTARRPRANPAGQSAQSSRDAPSTPPAYPAY